MDNNEAVRIGDLAKKSEAIYVARHKFTAVFSPWFQTVTLGNCEVCTER